MEPFVTHRGRVAVLDWTDVNTDLIIPARYLKRIERTGYGPLLFADKRYVPGGAPDPDTPGNARRRGARLPPESTPRPAAATILARGPQLRLRLEPRARRLGRPARPAFEP